MSFLDGVKSILLDIEGTTTPIDFVHDVLFSYARDHVRDFLTDNLDSAEVRADVALLREEHEVDVRESRNPPSLANDIESIATYVKWLIARDRKSTGLKSLQGKIWQQGYLAGVLKSQVFADVRPALERWRARGLSISIFSSGSVLAQRLLFAHTEAGDLTRFIDNYFDTEVGKKGEPNSYRRIAEALNLRSDEILFISDVVTELDAAREAGMKTLLSIRPGNPSQDHTDQYATILTFAES
ncbi:MAG TPA: acireductone synthase [Pyrinomonadaceae bacterium]